jgi:hypothetical protein
MSLTRTNCMNVPKLPLLHPERMTIRRRFFTRTIQSRKSHVDIHHTILHINHISSINHFNRRRQPEVTRRRIRALRIRIRATFKSRARRAYSYKHQPLSPNDKDWIIIPNGTVTLAFPKRSKYASPAAFMTSLESLSARGIASHVSPAFQYAVPVALKSQSPASLTSVSIFLMYSPSPSTRTPRTYLQPSISNSL